METERIMHMFLVLGFLIGGLLLALRMVLGKQIFDSFLSRWLFEITWAILTLPFKIIKSILTVFRPFLVRYILAMIKMWKGP